MSSTNKELIITTFPSPVGLLTAGATEQGVCLLEYDVPARTTRQQVKIEQQVGGSFVTGSNRHLEALQKQLQEYFDKARTTFDVPVVMVGTEFQKAAWKALQKIPYGKTCSYFDEAKAIGKPKAVRAVGSANGSNRISIVIPCHRVISKNGKLGGYGGELWRKEFLLNLEEATL